MHVLKLKITFGLVCGVQGSEDKLDVCQPWNEYFKIYNYIVSYIVKALLTFCLQEAIWDKKKTPMF